MEYEYQIYKPSSIDDIAATFWTHEPLAHIAKGNSLLPLIGDSSYVTGFHWLIRHVETYLFSPVDESHLERVRVSVFTVEQDRAMIYLE